MLAGSGVVAPSGLIQGRPFTGDHRALVVHLAVESECVLGRMRKFCIRTDWGTVVVHLLMTRAKVGKACGTAGQVRAGHRGAFTLLEMLVVMATMALLTAILLPALSSARGTVKALACSSNMRTVAMEFGLFAEGLNEAGRGDSERLGAGRFWMNDFVEQLYGLDEFWDLGEKAAGTMRNVGEPMLCPAGAVTLSKRRGLPCSTEAIGPAENISLGANMRLFRATVSFKGRDVLAPANGTYVSAQIMQHPYVPLVMDVDGREAAKRGVSPFYTAPPVAGDYGPYSTRRYWMPSDRHHGRMNVAFVGGHVLSSTSPENERWDWGYQAGVGR